MYALLDEAIKTKNKDQLHLWIKATTGYDIPRFAICAHHCAPFDFVADAIFQEFMLAIAHANRSGGKTQDVGIIEGIETFHIPNLEVVNVGAIQAQADRCYSYIKEIDNSTPFKENVDSLTATRGSYKNGATLQILPGTPSAVNGPHPQLNIIDELELMAYFVVQQALSMAQSKGDIPARTIITSTVKFATGLMIRMIEEFKARGLPVYAWCIWEVVKKLPKENPELMRRIYAVFGDELPANIERADGYYDWEDLINKKLTLDPETWSVEWVCNQPERSGLVYAPFEIECNVINPDNPRKEYRKPYVVNPWLPIYIFEDEGYGPNNPNVTLLCQVVGDDVIVFKEFYHYGRISADILPEIDRELYLYQKEGVAQESYGILDPAALTEREERIRHGRNMLDPILEREYYQLVNSIPLVRRKIADRTLQVASECVNLIEELQSYRYKKAADGQYTDTPDKKHDHGPDSLRYGFLILFPVQAAQAIGKQETPEERRPLAAGLMNKTF